MKKNFQWLILSIMIFFLIGCGGGGSDNNKSIQNLQENNLSDYSDIEFQDGIEKEEVCSLLSEEEVSHLVGKSVNQGKLDTEHIYPHASVCSWTSKENGIPLLILTYYLNASSHSLDYYAPPQLGATKDIIKEQNGTANETITVATSKNTLYEVISRSGNNAVLLYLPYLEPKEGSKEWKEAITLSNQIANRAKGE